MIHIQDCQIVFSEDKAELQALCVERGWPAEVIRNGWRHPVETTEHIWYVICWKSTPSTPSASIDLHPRSSAVASSSSPSSPSTPPPEPPK